MRRGQERHAQAAEQGQVHPINVRVDHIEFGRVPGHVLEQGCLRRYRVRARPAEPQGPRPNRYEFSAG